MQGQSGHALARASRSFWAPTQPWARKKARRADICLYIASANVLTMLETKSGTREVGLNKFGRRAQLLRQFREAGVNVVGFQDAGPPGPQYGPFMPG